MTIKCFWTEKCFHKKTQFAWYLLLVVEFAGDISKGQMLILVVSRCDRNEY